ncbi:site-specific integrase [Nonomuraea recticatena]|uniref:Tyr recombinase domain-containing protein n=1 Tax=Nonomuraea recticatena TaxID=46178 RepID=A0ABN3S4S5_9ACTN
MLDTYTGDDLHQLRHSAATRLGEAEVPLQLITGKTRHKNPRTAMRHVKPGANWTTTPPSASWPTSPSRQTAGRFHAWPSGAWLAFPRRKAVPSSAIA